MKSKDLSQFQKKNRSFIKRIFSKNEINFCNKKKINRFNYYSKRFAAKEAFSKALGTGIGSKLSFNEIEINNDKLGKPSIKIRGKSLKSTYKILKRKKFKIFLSISDAALFAVATVIIAF